MLITQAVDSLNAVYDALYILLLVPPSSCAFTMPGVKAHLIALNAKASTTA
jgi:hypothetical protein